MYIINQFNKEVENKNLLEKLEYATARLSRAENILIDTKACKNIDDIEEYINFLKWFIQENSI
jgi:hypothetical protein